jgi:hypothetical protein
MTTTRANTKMSETETLRADLELTRQHLADTVQELSRQLNVPRRIKDSATNAGHRAVQAAGNAKQEVPQLAKRVPELGRQHPRAAAAVGGAVMLGLGATAWIVGRGK